ncbi:hypothetical protein H0H87_012835, partial [Tephrocybe sp. NHM501043]
MEEKTPLVPHRNHPKSKALLILELNRLHKFPAGIDLVFWPCAWALAMASYHTSRPFDLFLFDFVLYGVASTLVHSAACVLNDICDKDLDAQERTKNRPIACGAITIKEALGCLIVEVIICLAVLAYMQDLLKFVIGFMGIFPFHGLYPLMKRLAMNWGFVVVWVHLVPDDNCYILPSIFFLGTVCWTIVYDTIYACQDRIDDIKAGNHSTAVLFGDQVKPILSIFAALFVAAFAVAGALNGHSYLYYTITVAGSALHLMWQLVTLRPDVPTDCWQKFK